MVQTENTAIVLRHADYRDNDRMVTLLSPSRGRIDAIIRNCRKPKSHNLNAGELFALGDYMLIETGGHVTVTSVRLIETFYPLRIDYDRLTCGIYLFIWMYKAGEQVNIAKSSRGLPVDSNSGVMYLLLTVFGLGIVAYALIQSELNHIAELYGAPPA